MVWKKTSPLRKSLLDAEKEIEDLQWNEVDAVLREVQVSLTKLFDSTNENRQETRMEICKVMEKLRASWAHLLADDTAESAIERRAAAALAKR